MRQLRRHLAKDTFEPLLAKAAKLTDRNGGYLRIIKLSGTRRGDDTQMALVQFVD
jgi:ribosomal protein L17